MERIEFDLFYTAPLGLLQRPLHRAGNPVRVQDGAAVEVTGRTADGLDQGVVRAQEAFLIGIQDGDQRDLRHIQPLTQQVDAHQHIKTAKSKVTDDFRALDCLDVRMQVPHPHIVVHAGNRSGPPPCAW